MLTSPNERSAGRTFSGTSSPIRALFILGTVGAVVWYGFGRESSNDTSQRIQTRGFVNTAKSGSDHWQVEQVRRHGDHDTNKFARDLKLGEDESGKKKAFSDFDTVADQDHQRTKKQQQVSADLIAQAIVPIDQLSAYQLQAWCREINKVRNSGMNCFGSKSALMQEFRGIVGFYNMPKLVPWWGQGPAFIGYTPRSQFKLVNTDNLKMYYQIWPQLQSSTPRNRPVVLIGGWSGVKEDWMDSATYWSQQASTKRTVMTVDIRGAGQTGFGPTAGDYTAPQIARDVSDLIKKVFPGEKVFLIGGALGGKIALQVALDYPGLLQAVIPCATVAGGALSVYGPLRATFIDLMVTDQRDQQPKRYAEAVYSPSFVAASTKWADLLQRGAKYNRPLAGILRQKNIAEQFDLSSQVGGISIPVLCMHGTQDKIDLPQSSQNLCTAIGANAQYEPLTNEGHAFWQMDPTEFVIDVETFFSAKGL